MTRTTQRVRGKWPRPRRRGTTGHGRPRVPTIPRVLQAPASHPLPVRDRTVHVGLIEYRSEAAQGGEGACLDGPERDAGHRGDLRLRVAAEIGEHERPTLG